MADDVLEQIPGEAPEDRFCRAMLGMVGCSSTVNPDQYTENIIRPCDRTPAMHSAYFGNTRLSTCQLAQEAGCRRAGMIDPEVAGHEPLDGGISGRQVRFYQRYGAWVVVGANLSAADMAALLTRSHGWWIDDGTGEDVHAGVCVTDAVVIDSSTLHVDTVEGGQFKVDDADPKEHAVGTTAQKHFTRTVSKHADGRWYMGARHIINVQLHDKLPMPLTPEAAGDTSGAAADDTGSTGRAVRGESTDGDE